MRHSLAFAPLLLSAVVPLHASTIDNFSFTGLDSSNHTYTIDFALNLANEHSTFGYDFNNVSATLNGVATTFNVDVYDFSSSHSSEYFDLTGSTFGQYISIDAMNGKLPVMAVTGSATPTFNLGSYSGVNDTDCEVALVARSPLPTLALIQAPVVTTTCGEAVSLHVTGSGTPTPPPPTTATPEPASLALLGTGCCGLVGMVRRRLRR